MNRIAQREIIAVWRARRKTGMLSNATYTDFFFDEIQPNPKYLHYNVYEVLDLLVNAGEIESQEPDEEPLEA